MPQKVSIKMSAFLVQPSATTASGFLENYRRRLDDLIHRVTDAVAATACSGWQDNYTANMENHRAVTKACCDRILASIEGIKQGGSDEMTEKDLKDAVKALAEERESHVAYMQRAVSRFMEAPTQLDNFIDKILRDAAELQQKSPLHVRGLVDEVRRELAEIPRAKWDSKTGIVAYT